ncbi:MAG TPA: VWA domain-containing protein [Vicinamibacteria bacterium]|nr:VWA domain-containing protein [Vicinamibacteria bacterium]
MRLVAVLLLAVLGVPARAEAPLDTASLVRFLRAGIGERTILAELKDRGFGEALDATREAALREAGASETLVVAVRAAAPEPAPVPPTARAAPLSVPPVAATLHEPTFAAATRTVRVPVSVLDKDGRPVMGLKGPDFHVLENGKPQEVTLFSGERRPLRLALALDLSGSMRSKVTEVQSALRHFIDLLEPQDEIMVLTFNDNVHTLQDFTSDRARLGKVFDMLEPVGGTALYDAAFESIRRVAGAPAESKAVVIVSDGVDTTSAVSFSQLREYARRSEVPVFSIGLGGADPIASNGPPSGHGPGGGGHRGWGGGGGHGGGYPGGGGGGGGYPGGGGGGRGGGHGPGGGSRKGFDPRPLVELADDTGGRAEILKEREHYSPDSDEPQGKLKEAVESIAMTLRHRYLLGYEPPAGAKGWRAIKVEVDRPPSEARTRKGYYAGS